MRKHKLFANASSNSLVVRKRMNRNGSHADDWRCHCGNGSGNDRINKIDALQDRCRPRVKHHLDKTQNNCGPGGQDKNKHLVSTGLRLFTPVVRLVHAQSTPVLVSTRNGRTQPMNRARWSVRPFHLWCCDCSVVCRRTTFLHV